MWLENTNVRRLPAALKYVKYLVEFIFLTKVERLPGLDSYVKEKIMEVYFLVVR